MLPIRKLKKICHYYPLRKKISALRKISNDKKIYNGVEETKQKEHLNVVTLIPN